MKKFFTAFVVAMAMVVVTPAQAQGVKFGIKGGYNITSMDFKNVSGLQSVYDMGKENKNGWYIGPSVKVSLAAGLGADIAALFDQRKTEVEGEDVTMKYIYVPVNLRYNIGLGGAAGIYLAAGPQVGFNVGDTDIDLKYFDDTKQQINDKFQLKKATFGINLGAGVYLSKHLEVGAVYNIPLGNTADIEGTVADVAKTIQDKYDVKSNTFQVSAAFYF